MVHQATETSSASMLVQYLCFPGTNHRLSGESGIIKTIEDQIHMLHPLTWPLKRFIWGFVALQGLLAKWKLTTRALCLEMCRRNFYHFKTHKKKITEGDKRSWRRKSASAACLAKNSDAVRLLRIDESSRTFFCPTILGTTAP